MIPQMRLTSPGISANEAITKTSTRPLAPQASASTGTSGFPGKHHPRLSVILPPLAAPKLHPAALSPANVALFPTSPGATEGSETGNPALSDPQAEGHPGSSLRGLPARPAAHY